MRRLIKFIYKLGLLVISLTIIFVIYSQTGWFKKNLRELILKNAPTYLNGELRLGPVAGNFFTGIEINNVSLADSTGVVFSAERIEAKYDPFGFFFDRISIVRLLLVNPTMTFFRSSDSVWNFQRLLKPAPKDTVPSSTIISIRQVQVVNGWISYADSVHLIAREKHIEAMPKPTEIDYSRFTLKGFDLVAGMRIAPSEYNLDIKRLSFHSTEPLFALQNFTGSFYLSKKKAEIKDLSIETPQTRISADVSMWTNFLKPIVLEEFKRSPLDISLRIERFEFRELQQFLPKAVDFLSGNVRLTVQADGSLDHLNVMLVMLEVGETNVKSFGTLKHLLDPKDFELDIRGRKCTIDPSLAFSHLPGLNIPNLNKLGLVNFDYDFKGRPLNFSSWINGDIVAGSFDISGDFDFEQNPTKYSIEGSVKDFDVGTLLKTSTLASNLNVKATLNGNGFKLGNLTTLAQVEIDSSRFRNLDIHRSTLIADIGKDSGRVWLRLNSGQSSYQTTLKAYFSGDTIKQLHYDGNIISMNLAELLQDDSLESALSFNFRGSVSGADIVHSSQNLQMIFQNSSFRNYNFGGDTVQISYETSDSIYSAFHFSTSPLEINVNGRFTLPSFFTAFGSSVERLSSEVINEFVMMKPLRGFTGKAFTITPRERTDYKFIDTIDVNFKVDVKDFFPLGVIVGMEMSGEASVGGAIRGISDSVRVDALGKIKRFELMKSGMFVLLDSTTIDYFSNPQSRLSKLEYSENNVSIDSKEIIFNNSKFNDINFHWQNNGRYGGFEITGLFDSSLSVSSSGSMIFDQQRILIDISRVKISFADFKFENESTIPIELGSDGALIGGFRLTSGEESITGGGFFTPVGVSDLSFAVQRFSLTRLHSFGKQGEEGVSPFEGISGITIASGFFRGSFDHPNLQLNLSIDSLKVRNVLFGNLFGSFSYFENVLSIHRLLIKGSDAAGELFCQGTLPLRFALGQKPDTSSFTAENDLHVRLSKFRLEFFDPFLVGLRNLKGTLSADLKVIGTSEKPDYVGYAIMKDVWFFLEPIQMDFGFNGRFNANGETITLEDCYLKNRPSDFKEDSMKVNGTLSLKGFALSFFDFNATGQLMVMKESAPIPGQMMYGDLVIEVSKGGLRWQGDLNRSLFKADLVSRTALMTIPPLKPAVYLPSKEFPVIYVDDTSRVLTAEIPAREENKSLRRNGQKNLAAKRNNSANSEQAQQTSLMDRMVQDINLETRGITQFRFIFNERLNEELLADLKGKLNYNREATIMRVSGELELTDRSYYLQFGKRFNAAGNLLFTGDITNPELRVTATYTGMLQLDTSRTKKVSVIIEISGTIKEPKPKFALEEDGERDARSDSEIESDALSFILTGKYKNALSPEELATVNSTVAVGLASSMLARPFSDYARQFGFSVDVLYYGGNFQQEADVRLTGAVGDAVVKFGGRVFNDINNANIGVQLPMSSLLSSDSWRNVLLEIESKVEGVESIDQRRANALKLLYRLTF